MYFWADIFNMFDAFWWEITFFRWSSIFLINSLNEFESIIFLLINISR